MQETPQGGREASLPEMLPKRREDWPAERLGDLARLYELTEQPARIIVVTGPEGVGKTALTMTCAQRIKDRYEDGQLFARLAVNRAGRAADPIHVLRTFITALGGNPGAPFDLQTEYKRLTVDRRLLVVLDGAYDSMQVMKLVPAGEQSLTLITSRYSLAGLSRRHRMLVRYPIERPDPSEV